EWARQPGGTGDAALRDAKVDLWPVISIIPERTQYMHLTKAYLESSYGFVVRSASPYSEVAQLAEKVIGHNGARINARNLKILLPNAPVAVNGSVGEAIDAVCVQRADAALADELTLVTAMLKGRSCSSQELRLIPIPGVRISLGVGSTFAAAPVAE